MKVSEDEILFAKCLNEIERKLNWGNSDGWTNQDFEVLGEKILAETGINLSIITLKRLWGRIRYNSKPTITTLNALANFIGYENWRSFKQVYGAKTESDVESLNSMQTPGTENNTQKTKIGFIATIAAVTAAICLVGYFVLLKNPGFGKINPSRFSFSSKKMISEGLPNSVVFDYDASAASTSDTVYIQQSWDKHLSQQVSRMEHHHTSIYYYPGFFRAKLVVAGRVMKEHNLDIKTNGWLPLIEQPGIPVYLTEAAIKQNGVLSLPISSLQENHINLQPVTPWVSFYKVEEFKAIETDNFVFETKIRNDYKEGAAACQKAEIYILCENGAIIIPLSAKGCIADLKMYLVDKPINGTTEDLSLFGCNLSDWVNVVCRVKDKKINISINGVPAYQSTFTTDATRIEGLRYRFQGTGSVASVKLAKLDGEVVYEDHFR